MEMHVVNLKEKADKIQELHKYKLIAELNNYQFKLVKANREFVWHKHDETDEAFFVVEGHMTVATREKDYLLNAGEMIVVPKGVEHRPVYDSTATVMLIEPSTTINTGNVGGPMTDTELERI